MTWKTKKYHRDAENTNLKRCLYLKYTKNLTIRKENFKWAKYLDQTPHQGKAIDGEQHTQEVNHGKAEVITKLTDCCMLRRMYHKSVFLGARLLPEK